MIYVFIRTTGESGYVSEQTVCLSALRLHPEEILGRQYSLNCGRTKHKKRCNDLLGSNLIKRGFTEEDFTLEQKIVILFPFNSQTSIAGMASKQTNLVNQANT